MGICAIIHSNSDKTIIDEAKVIKETFTTSYHTFENYIFCLKSYLMRNQYVILMISLAAFAAYGFELFNLNLTIDEEVHAFGFLPSVWITQGRWGMYLLNKFLLPHTIIPFLPLFVALLFHIAGTLLMLEVWQVESKIEKILIGALCTTYPGIAYMYTFSTINYGIGVGIFSTALSVFIFARGGRVSRYLAVIPAAFALAIYQGFVLALAAVFLIYFIVAALRQNSQFNVRTFLAMVMVVILGGILYYSIHKILVTFFIPESTYVGQFFKLDYLYNNIGDILNRLWLFLISVYSGDKAVYGLDISVLLLILVAALIGMGITLFRSHLPLLHKLIILIFVAVLVVLPYSVGIVMSGSLHMRFLVVLPIVISGVVMLGIYNNLKPVKFFLLTLAVLCVYQFIASNNYLFASSHFALQEDRAIGIRLINDIDEAKRDAGVTDVKYMEVVGYLSRSANSLVPHLDTFGASFFEWDQGNVGRIIPFLKTLGYEGMAPLSFKDRGDLVEITNSMPNWPAEGSILIHEDIVIVKFGPYSNIQKYYLCNNVKKEEMSAGLQSMCP